MPLAESSVQPLQLPPSPSALSSAGTLASSTADHSIIDNRIATTLEGIRWSPVEVHVGAYHSRNLRLPDAPLARKRAGLWHHEERNNAIAAISRAFLRGDLEALWPFGLFLGRQYTLANIPFLRPTWLAIAVEVPAHARALSTLLPDFAIGQAYASHSTPWSPRMILTQAAMAELDVFMPTLLLNAVGGRHALSLPWYEYRSPETPGAIIELADKFDDQARQETAKRLLQYGFRRWPVFTRSRLTIDPATIPTRSRTRKSTHQRRWTAGGPTARKWDNRA